MLLLCIDFAYAPNPVRWIDPLGLYKGEGSRELGKYHAFHEHTLNPEQYTLSDSEHFRLANESVYQRAQMDTEFRQTLQTKYPGVLEHVSPTQTGRFRGTSPPDMTWRHGDSPGSLKLVDHDDHRSFHKITIQTGRVGEANGVAAQGVAEILKGENK
jgi:hypothetical protein